MTARHIFSRPLVAVSAIASLAAAVALTAAPSTARAETASSQNVQSDGAVDCAPCRLFRIDDQDGLSFRALTGEVQDGNLIVITATVTAPGTAGRPRTGSVVFSVFMDAADDSGFMDYTDDACTSSLLSRQAGTQACDAISRAFRDAATAASTPSPTIAVPPATGMGIIMRDGGVCDPIRHMGC